ncbi:MAG: antitoxin family protein [Deltaproteobacteria bacterium]|nr:antitoxin family protein [Deltaproteobacteria bacterium]
MGGPRPDGQGIEVVYEGGVFRPVRPLRGVEEHRRACVILEPPAGAGTRFADPGWSLSPEEADEMARVVDAEFDRIEDDW